MFVLPILVGGMNMLSSNKSVNKGELNQNSNIQTLNPDSAGDGDNLILDPPSKLDPKPSDDPVDPTKSDRIIQDITYDYSKSY